jgi:GT2 family glycosyltransferase
VWDTDSSAAGELIRTIMAAPTGEPAHRPTGSPRVGIVVVNWRRPEATRACLRALAAMTYRNWFAVVVDNGTADFADAGERAVAPDVAYAHSAVNLGFAGGSNLGMRAALGRGADWVWFLNDDALPEPEALSELLAAAERPPRPALLGAKIVQCAHPERLIRWRWTSTLPAAACACSATTRSIAASTTRCASRSR